MPRNLSQSSRDATQKGYRNRLYYPGDNPGDKWGKGISRLGPPIIPIGSNLIISLITNPISNSRRVTIYLSRRVTIVTPRRRVTIAKNSDRLFPLGEVTHV